MRIEIMDTTLRDGEQTSGVSFSGHEKLNIARLLLEKLNVDRIEVASARVSEGERDAVKRICEWAERNGYINRIEVLGFVDGGQSLGWIEGVGAKAVNLLCKGSYKHCTEQLHKSPEEHLADIKSTIADAKKREIAVNIYLEDWSNGMLSSPEYVRYMIDNLKDEPISRFMLPDTLGILGPTQTYDMCRQMVERYPTLHFDFHAHNDYDLAVANTLYAVRAGVHGVHATVNGLGERAGNAPLSSVMAVLHDKSEMETALDETNINHVSKIVETYSGIRIPSNKPIIGDNVFTQCAGIHADGDNKNQLYFNDLMPERFGRTRQYALGKMSGKANIAKNLEALGIELDTDAMRKVTDRIIALGDRKELVTADDLPYIISDVLKTDIEEDKVQVIDYVLSAARGLPPTATVKISIRGVEFLQTAIGDGQYDAFMRAIRNIYKHQLGRDFPMLTNYTVDIPPGGRTDAFVQTTITWRHEDNEFKTRGLDADQTEAAIKATIKMLNRIEN